MPLGQFDERLPIQLVPSLSDTAVANTFTPLYSAIGRDARIDVLLVSNSDTIVHHVAIDLNASGDNGVVIECQVPARAGYDGASPFDILGAAFPAGQQFLIAPAGNEFDWCVREAINSGRFVVAYVQGGQY